MEIDLFTLSNRIVDWIKEYTFTNKISSLIVGVSGGVDSGLVSTLCAKTNLPLYVISMPVHQEHTQLERARNHCKWLTDNFSNVTFIEKDLTQVFESFKHLFINDYNKQLAFANTNGIVVGTGNKVEDFGIGFYTKYGDGGVDISPIADLTKTEVRLMCKILNVPEYIVNAVPTDGLWEDNRTDENQIGASYEELEWAMYYDGSHKITERQNKILNIYRKLNIQNNHKMIPIPIFKKI